MPSLLILSTLLSITLAETAVLILPTIAAYTVRPGRSIRSKHLTRRHSRPALPILAQPRILLPLPATPQNHTQHTTHAGVGGGTEFAWETSSTANSATETQKCTMHPSSVVCEGWLSGHVLTGTPSPTRATTISGGYRSFARLPPEASLNEVLFNVSRVLTLAPVTVTAGAELLPKGFMAMENSSTSSSSSSASGSGNESPSTNHPPLTDSGNKLLAASGALAAAVGMFAAFL
ncbi:hypothetical protein DM02DRAFT_625665 [Periconia macrospinosa]|uniref:Uncharacterized protein n=1 Tax=Periconia macrospinosa TaxID=97972 RepID=A0A2V1E1S8_9PLEO|nr:hypothetical protein DM02DRAFT_625665 [Periconia macrospinosa]